MEEGKKNLLEANLKVRHIRTAFFGNLVTLMIKGQPAVHEAEQLEIEKDKMCNQGEQKDLGGARRQSVRMTAARIGTGKKGGSLPFRRIQTFCAHALPAGGRRIRDSPGKSDVAPSPEWHPPFGTPASET